MSTAPTLPTPAQAEALIRRHAQMLPVESRPLAALACGVLAQAVRAERDQPPFDRVTTDGIAVASDAWRAGQRRYRIAGVQRAGVPPQPCPPDACVQVMTGAVLPPGSDCVIPAEHVTVADGWAEVEPEFVSEPFLNVHTRGLDCREGDMLLARGTRLGPPELAVLASAGLPRANVRAEPRILIVATGDELVEPGEPIEAWQVRRSNAYALRGALALRGYLRVGEDHLPDDPTVLRERLARHLATHDVLVLSGGVSMGRSDHVPRTLRDLGVKEILHRVAQRPGRPLWFGVGPIGQPVFGLPGNPVSALVCLVRYVVPGLQAIIGLAPRPPEPVVLGAPCRVKPALWQFLPVQLDSSPKLGTVALPRPTRGSGDFISLLGTDGFVELTPGPAEFAAGHVAPLYRW
jgi:molybdopterin molybdotransferase